MCHCKNVSNIPSLNCNKPQWKICDKRGTRAKGKEASLFDQDRREGHAVLQPTNQISSVGDPPAKRRTAPLGSIATISDRKCKQSSAPLLPFLPEFGGKLEKDICGDTSGHYQKLLVILVQVERGAAGKTYVSFPDNESLWRCHYKVMRGLGVEVWVGEG